MEHFIKLKMLIIHGKEFPLKLIGLKNNKNISIVLGENLTEYVTPLNIKLLFIVCYLEYLKDHLMIFEYSLMF